jgi:multidrug efflux system membrane fusion protein
VQTTQPAGTNNNHGNSDINCPGIQILLFSHRVSQMLKDVGPRKFLIRNLIFLAITISLVALLVARRGHWNWRPLHSTNTITPTREAGSSKELGKSSSEPPAPVVSAKVEKRDVPIYFDGIGTIQAYNTVSVSSRVTGQITRIAFKEGQDVKAGDLLAIVDPRPFQASLDQAIAKKAQDVAQLENARAVYARDNYLLTKRVLAPQDSDVQKYLVDQFDAQVQSDVANIESAQANLDYCQITSPIDGRIGIRLLDQGNIVQGTATAAICTVTQLKPISLLFTLPQTQLTQVNEQFAKGPLRVIAVDTSNTETLSEGILSVVNNQIDTTTGTFQLKATFANQDLKLWPGEFVNARLLIAVRKAGLVIPAQAIQRGPEGTFVYIIDANQIAQQQIIRVSQIDGGVALIDDGLPEGENVVVDGQYRLQRGAKVGVISRAQDP